MTVAVKEKQLKHMESEFDHTSKKCPFYQIKRHHELSEDAYVPDKPEPGDLDSKLELSSLALTLYAETKERISVNTLNRTVFVTQSLRKQEKTSISTE